MNSLAHSTSACPHRIAIFIPTYGDGGVERMLVNLARGLAARSLIVDFLVKDTDAPHLSSLTGAGVNLIDLHATRQSALLAALVRYLDQVRPDVLMSAKGKDDRLVVRAKRLTKTPVRVFLRIGTNISARLDKRGKNPVARWLTYRSLRHLCTQADGVICVSQGVADDVAHITKLPRDKIQVIRNPVVTPELLSLASQPVSHPWFSPGQPPVILGAGGLRNQKNFPMLIRAFAWVRSQMPCRLVILGDGHLRPRLERLAEQLGVAADVSLPGFAENPFAYMAKAALFVLSSNWEGSPNALTEALAVGTPVVSTDCPSGPREILQGGRFGTLVPVGDTDALGRAILASLTAPADTELLHAATEEYTVEHSTTAYLRAFDLL